MPVETQKMLRSQLNFDEKLIWSGQPLANRVGSGSLVLVLVGIPLTVLSVVWVVVLFWVMVSWKMNSSASSSPSSGPPLFAFVFPLFGVPFVLAGLWMLSAPYRMRRKAQKTVYAVTNKRALILSPEWRGGVTVRSIAPEDLTARMRTQNPDGSGTLVFTRLTTTQRAGGGPAGHGGTYEVTVGFENISDVRDVDALIERTFNAPQRG
jgi:hypothetical protein